MKKTKVKRSQEEKRLAAAAANRRSRLKKKMNQQNSPNPNITTVTGELTNVKRPRGRPVKHQNDTSRRNAKRDSDRIHQRNKRLRKKEEKLLTLSNPELVHGDLAESISQHIEEPTGERNPDLNQGGLVEDISQNCQ